MLLMLLKRASGKRFFSISDGRERTTGPRAWRFANSRRRRRRATKGHCYDEHDRIHDGIHTRHEDADTCRFRAGHSRGSAASIRVRGRQPQSVRTWQNDEEHDDDDDGR